MTTSRTLALAASLWWVVSGPAHAWDAERGQQISAVCAACHGPDGNSPSPDFPTIAGQYREYLFRALLDYRLGNRQDPITAGQVAELSRRDMRDLAAFYANQEGLYLKR
jgi:cytochrome c553